MESEWQTTTLANAPLEIIDGDRGVNYPNQTEFYTHGHCLFLNAGNVTDDGFNFSGCAFITPEKDALLRKGKLVRNDVVLTTRGTVGNSAYFDNFIPFEHIRINSGMVILRANKTAIYPRYLYFFIRSTVFHSQVAALRTGSAQPQLPIRDINRIEIPIPSIDKQRAIAETLGALDDKIAINRQTNATLEAIAQALFKSWFVDFDPVRAKMEGREPEGMDEATAALFPSELVESELGLIPKGWNVGILGDICQNYREGVMPENIEPHFPYIGLEHMPRKSISLNEWGVSKGLESGKFRFVVGDILFGKLRPYFHKVGTAPIDGICSTDILVIRPKISDWYGFSLGHLSSSALIDYAEKLSNGAKMPRTNWGDLSKYRVALPDFKTAKVLSEVFESFVYKIRVNIIQSRTLADIRDSLLPKLISGQLRIPEAEEVIESIL